MQVTLHLVTDFLFLFGTHTKFCNTPFRSSLCDVFVLVYVLQIVCEVVRVVPL